MKRWELRSLRFHSIRTGIIDKDAAIIIGGIIVTVIVVTETIPTQTIPDIEVDLAMAEIRTRVITRTTKYKSKVERVR